MAKKKMEPVMMIMASLMLLSLIFAIVGISMHQKVKGEEKRFHSIQDSYFVLDKETRDNAASNSQLSQQLMAIKNYPSELLRLKLVGVGRILVGIYILLFAILMALVMMPKRLAAVMKKR